MTNNSRYHHHQYDRELPNVSIIKKQPKEGTCTLLGICVNLIERMHIDYMVLYKGNLYFLIFDTYAK